MLFTKRVLPLVSWFINDIDLCNSKPINVLKWYVGLNDLFTHLLQSKRWYWFFLIKRRKRLRNGNTFKCLDKLNENLLSCDTGCDLCALKFQFLNTSTNPCIHPNLWNLFYVKTMKGFWILTTEYRIRDEILWVSMLMNCLDMIHL